MRKVDCVVCGHSHVEGQPCQLCHCAAGVSEHPQGKAPLAERYDAKADRKYNEGVNPYTSEPVPAADEEPAEPPRDADGFPVAEEEEPS